MKRLPALAVALFLAAAVAWIGSVQKTTKVSSYPPGSSLQLGPGGLSQLRGVLEALGARTATLTRSLRIARLPANAVLFRIEPLRHYSLDLEGEGTAPPPDDSDADEAFMRAGGRLIIAVEGEVLEDEGAAVKVAPLLPGVDSIAPPTAYAIPSRLLVDAQPVFEHGAFPCVAVRRVGQGELWLLAEPEALHNEHLEKNLAMGVALAGQGRPVYFDEAIHGDEDEGGPLELLKRWGLGPALLLAGLALLAAFWRAAAILGPPADDYRETRVEAVDLVESMAALYDEALESADALGLYRARLLHEIALRKAVSEKSAEQLLPRYAPGFDLTSKDFRSQLILLTSGFSRLRDEHRRDP
ncbi:MAG TPA: DUF4350 domain-containing protein [Myxococcales bacterium]|nr:DUF4350 domain-containing protein [Myxococcales bacterium]